jgi:hypothetical protein
VYMLMHMDQNESETLDKDNQKLCTEDYFCVVSKCANRPHGQPSKSNISQKICVLNGMQS